MKKMITKYIEYLRYEKNYSSHTEISYLNDLLQFADFLENHHSGVSLEEIDGDLIRLWMVDLMKGKIVARSVNRKLSALKSFFGYLQRKGILNSNPAVKILGPRMAKPIPSFVNDKDMDILLPVNSLDYSDDFVKFRDVLLIELLYVTGIRRAELIGLKDEDIDYYSQTISVVGKRNKQRLVPLSVDMCNKIRLYVSVRNEELDAEAEALFVREDGRALYPMLVYRIVNEQLSQISTLSKASPHVLRHTFATSMLNNGADINAVKEILGHSSLAATEVYTHTSFEELKSIYNKAHPRA